MEELLLVLVSGLVGAGGAIASTTVGNRAAARLRHEDRAFRQRERVEGACFEFIRALDSYIAALDMMPFATRAPGRLDRLAERYLGDFLTFGAILLQRLLFGYRWERLLDSVIGASARLRVVAPEEVRGVVDDVHELLTNGPDLTTDEGAREWKALRDKLAASGDLISKL